MQLVCLVGTFLQEVLVNIEMRQYEPKVQTFWNHEQPQLFERVSQKFLDADRANWTEINFKMSGRHRYVYGV